MTEFKQLLLSGEQHLAKDPIMQSLIEQFGHCVIEPHSDHYQELFESIISQQLSVKAAAAILGRTRALFDGRTPLPEPIL